MDKDFYTLKGYDRLEHTRISPAMEDYLEMICRFSNVQDYVRIGFLADQLHVQPSSASKMVNRLKEQGLVDFEPYGILRLTPEGKKMGAYLLHRHDVLNRFFCYLNGSDDQLEQVEKIEHFMHEETVKNLEKLLNSLSKEETSCSP